MFMVLPLDKGRKVVLSLLKNTGSLLHIGSGLLEELLKNNIIRLGKLGAIGVSYLQ